VKGDNDMADLSGPHLRLQQQIDCWLETNPVTALETWDKAGWGDDDPGWDVDEAPLKYMALVFLYAVENRIVRFTVDREKGATFYGETTTTLPNPPSQIIARALEIVREITDLEKPSGQSTLSLGVRNDGVEVIIQKERGLHTFNIPGIG
jgi:hypothetical protein